jgi:multidrug efflux system outer membrane protein
MPAVPAGLPSDLLERRPDVAEAERLLVASNAEIGIAQAAWFPSLKLTAGIGMESFELQKLFDQDNRIWSLGASLMQPVFDGGRIRGNVTRAKAAWEENLARYQERLLVAFREVETALSALDALQHQVEAEAVSISNAEETARLALARYRRGLVIFLEVTDAQRSVLAAQRSSLQLRNQQLAITVVLVKALGGGWEGRQGLPSAIPSLVDGHLQGNSSN